MQRLLGNGVTARKVETSRDAQGPAARTTVQRKPKTEKEKFQAKTFKLKEFIPSTQVGNFDVEYSPKTGEMKVIMKLHFDFSNVHNDYKSQAVNKKDTKWTAAQKNQWAKEFETAILSVWGNISEIRCTRPGWEDVVARPRIVIKQVGKGKGNFDVAVDKAYTTDMGKMRTATGGTSVGGLNREDKAAFQEQDNKDKINDTRVKNHLQQAEKNINIEPALKRDHERLEQTLLKLPAAVRFKAGSAAIEGTMVGHVQNIAKAITDLRKDSALSKHHPLQIRAGTAATEPVSLAAGRFHAVKEALVAGRVENLFVSKALPNRASGVRIDAADTTGLLDIYVANWKRLTVAHEFGHMLGLLDEYCQAVSPDLIQMMIDEGRLDPGYVMTSESQGRVAQDADKQTEYAKMLKANDLETPTWARPTATGHEKSTSLMSGGFEIMKQHYVTLWEAIGRATEPTLTKGDWKLG